MFFFICNLNITLIMTMFGLDLGHSTMEKTLKLEQELKKTQKELLFLHLDMFKNLKTRNLAA